MPEQLTYAEAVEYLADNPEEIFEAWEWTGIHNAGALFLWCTPSRGGMERNVGPCGCLTMVHNSSPFGPVAWTDELTDAIRADNRIPDDMTNFKNELMLLPRAERVARLSVFREWQERLDREIRS